MLKLPGGKSKHTPEELAIINLEEIKKLIVAQDPKAFNKKTITKKAASNKNAKKSTIKIKSKV